MNRLITLLQIFTLLGILFSCGQKADITKARVTLVAGLTAIVPGQTGGTMLFGFNPDTGVSFSKVFDGVPLELPNGRWEFAAISWDGYNTTNADFNNVMEGVTRCSVVRGTLLNGGEANVALTLSNAGCADPFFGNGDTRAANGEPLPLLPATCTDQRGVFDTFDAGTCKNSTSSSYRVILPSKGPGSVGPGLISACVDEQTVLTPELDSTIRKIKTPIFSPGPWNFAIVIDLYDQAGCAGQVDRVVVENPYAGLANRGAARLNSQSTTSLTANEIRISKNPCSSPAGTGATPFSPVAGERIICTPAQFDTFIPANLNLIYELYADLDFSTRGTYPNAVVNNTFTGMLDGRGHTIRNVTINSPSNAAALFRQIDGTGTFPNNSEASIQKLKLENFNITAGNNSNGALVGNVFLGSRIWMVDAQNISFTLNGAGTTQTGGLIGRMDETDASTNGGSYTEAWGLRVKDISINVTGNHDSIGGIVGHIRTSNGLRNSIVENLTFTSSAATVSKVGGAVGQLSQTGGEIFAVTANNIQLGTSGSVLGNIPQMGGLVGLVTDGRVIDSKAVSTIYGGGNEIGGLVGGAYGVDFRNNVSLINILSAPIGTSVGGHIGLSGISTNNPTIKNSRALGSIQCATTDCGGFIGTIMNSSTFTTLIEDSYADVVTTSTTSVAGGFIGNSNNSGTGITINRCAAYGDVTGTADVGGFIGQAIANNIVEVFSQGQVSVSSGLGSGLIALLNAGSIVQSYTSSSVVGASGTKTDCISSEVATPTVTDVYHISDGASDGNCTALATAIANAFTNYTNFDISGTTPWKNVSSQPPSLKSINAVQGVGESYTGSPTDPIILSTPSQWNSIGDKPSLMDKTFRLGNIIDFSPNPSNFVPIGSNTNPFTGEFQPNNQGVSNINFIDNTNSEPLGLFRVIGTAAGKGSGRIEQRDYFDYDKDFAFYIDNVSLVKNTSILGHTGIVAGKVFDDGTNQGNGVHDYQYAVAFAEIYITNSNVYGGGATYSVGGAFGNVTLTNEQSDFYDIYVIDTTIDGSATTDDGIGGIFGSLTGSLVSNTGNIRMDNFIARNVYVGNATVSEVGGIAGNVNHTQLEFEFFRANGDITGLSQVGGHFGTAANAQFINGSFDGTVTAAGTSAGGIAGDINTTLIKNVISRAIVLASGAAGAAGCLNGTITAASSIENSIGNCPSVTAPLGTSSYFTNSALNTSTVNSIYTQPIDADEGLSTNFVNFVTQADFVNPSATSAILTAGDPWVLEPGLPPLPIWEAFPEFFE